MAGVQSEPQSHGTPLPPGDGPDAVRVLLAGSKPDHPAAARTHLSLEERQNIQNATLAAIRHFLPFLLYRYFFLFSFNQYNFPSYDAPYCCCNHVNFPNGGLIKNSILFYDFITFGYLHEEQENSPSLFWHPAQ